MGSDLELQFGQTRVQYVSSSSGKGTFGPVYFMGSNTVIFPVLKG